MFHLQNIKFINCSLAAKSQSQSPKESRKQVPGSYGDLLDIKTPTTHPPIGVFGRMVKMRSHANLTKG